MKNKQMTRREPLTDTQLLMTITIGIFMVMYILAMILFGGGFLHVQQIFDMLNDNASLIIVSCGLTIVMIGGGIDISVGAVTSLVVMSCVLYLNNGGNIFVSILLALGIGLAFGVVHGFLISYLEIQPFIVTLAGMFFARGMTTILSVNPQKAAHEGFLALMDAKIEIGWLGYVAKNGNRVPARMELGVVVALICVIVIFIMLKYIRLGRNFYAMGGNQQSALMLGINVKRTRFMSYLICGLLSGISGYVFMMHTGAGNATNAAGMEMNAIASSIIGGTLLTGGVGNVAGTFFGVMTLTTIKKIVVSSGLNDPWWQSIT
ncbi:MAG: sugar ABC transporter permease YjfF, partial [Lachnospiraceae bacterium]|nr:sugar ABC transporter permease YjfF [Lachnospiraceae bacterium]